MNKFRNASNQRLYRGLFFETSNQKETVVYTLKDVDHETELGLLPSLYLLYMAAGDPTEYSFAIANLDGWDHWDRLSKASWFQPYVSRWRLELSVRLRSEALARIAEEAKSTSKNRFAANKFLVEKPWDRATKGRPTKAQVDKAANEQAAEDRLVLEAFERLTDPARPN